MYWGKIIGLGVGLLSRNVWIAMAAVLVGHQFDRGFADRYREFRRDYGRTFNRRVGKLPEPYLRALFQLMGHLAKVDGRVSEAEIRAARSVMHRMELKPAQVRNAIRWFEDGKRIDFPVQQTAKTAVQSAARRAELRPLFLRLLLDVALAKPKLDRRERDLLWLIAQVLEIGRVEFAQLEAMIRAQKGFRDSPAGNADADRVREAYATLGVDSNASNAEIKTAYRRLMSQHHPDKLAGSDPDETTLATAEQRTRDVRRAYELLKARRSMR
ncbi:MAG: co-chaperone DjlA [Pseudomonadota bacterium]